MAPEVTTGRGDVHLCVGCAPDVPLARLKAFLGALYAREPGVRVHVLHLPTSEQLIRLRLGELDAGVIHDAVEGDGVEVGALFDGEPMAAFLPIGHPLACAEAITPDHSAAETLVLVPRAVDPGVHARMTGALIRAGHPFHRVVKTAGADPRDVLFAVAEGYGLTVGPRSLLTRFADMAGVVTCRPLAGAPRMPATVLALPCSPEPHMHRVTEAVRGAACDLHGPRLACLVGGRPAHRLKEGRRGL